MDDSRALAAFAALSQLTRLDVFRLLVHAGPDGCPAGHISDMLKVRPNTLSANLAVLRGAGLVKSRREGRSIRYFADLEGLQRLLAFLMQDCCGGRPELCQPAITSVTPQKETTA